MLRAGNSRFDGLNKYYDAFDCVLSAVEQSYVNGNSVIESFKTKDAEAPYAPMHAGS